MHPDILFVSKKQNRGGAIYEQMVKNVLESGYSLDLLELDARRNKLLFFDKLKYFYQIKSYKPAKKYHTLITNKVGVYAGILKKKFSRKILVLHHYYNEENTYPLVNKLLKNRLLSNIDKFDTVVVVSEYWKKFFGNYTDIKKIHPIYNSFDVEKINLIKSNLNKESFKAKHGIPQDKITVYAGNALEIKGYLDVIRLLDKDKFFIVTSGNQDKNAVHAHLHLKLNYEEYIQLLCTADVTVILSKFQEGWSRIAHESLVCGTGVIGTNVAGMGELLQNARQYIYKENDDLSALIIDLLNKKELITFGQNFASQYDEAYFKKAWEEILQLNNN